MKRFCEYKDYLNSLLHFVKLIDRVTIVVPENTFMNTFSNYFLMNFLL